jgi:hypothetical protein
MNELLSLSSSVASVSGALSAIAFGFLQVSQGQRLGWLKERSSAISELVMKIRAANRDIGKLEINENIPEDVLKFTDFQRSLRSVLEKYAAKKDSGAQQVFERLSDVGIDHLIRALLERAGVWKEAVAFFTASYLAEIEKQTVSIELLTQSIDIARKREVALYHLVAISGLSVLFLCAGAIPPIIVKDWTLQNVELYAGMCLIFAFFATAFAEALNERFQAREAGSDSKVLVVSLAGYAASFCLAFILFVAHAIA